MSIALNGDGIISGVSSISNPSDITVGTGASVFSPAANTLALGTNGSERVRVNSSGNVGIGTDNPGNKLEVNSGTDNEGIKVVSTDAGSYITFADNSTTGSTRLGVVGDDFKIDVNSSEKLRVLAAGGLTFNGDTAAANALDDYEEGTWTPTVGGTATYTTQAGNYTKVGNLVIATFLLRINSLGTGANDRINGLPFTIAGDNASTVLYYYAGLPSNIVDLTFGNGSGSTTVFAYAMTAAGTGLGPYACWTNGTDIRGAIVYRT